MLFAGKVQKNFRRPSLNRQYRSPESLSRLYLYYIFRLSIPLAVRPVYREVN